MAARPTVVRVQGLPSVEPEHVLRNVLDTRLQDTPFAGQYKFSLVPACDGDDEVVALVDFVQGLPGFLSELKAKPLESWQVMLDDSDDILSFDRHFHGFTQLYQNDDSKPIEADIVAICGLDAHAYGSWQGRGNVRPMWLRQFLARDLPNCRTLTYGYHAKLASYSFATAEDYTKELLEDLKRVRQGDAQRRPLIFIAHSFGGIILARAMIKIASSQNLDDSFAACLYKSICGIMFFAVPHRGLDVDDMARIMGAENHPRTGILQHININSDQLRVQLEDFTNVIGDRKVVSLFETEQSKRLVRNSEGEWKREGDYFTNLASDSAILQLPDSTETRIPIHRDHSSIIKFDSRADNDYKRCRYELQTLTARASDIVKGRFAVWPAKTTKRSFALPFGLPEAPMIEHFTGRESELRILRGSFLELFGRKIVTLQGMGGVGKTQLAIAYAQSRSNKYPVILWLNGSHEHSLQQSFRVAAQRLASVQHDWPPLVKAAETGDILETVQVMKQWLSLPENHHWLMIFDNVDDPKIPGDPGGTYDLSQYFPYTLQGHILITTRSSRLRMGHVLHVKVIQNHEDRLKILLDSSKRSDILEDPDADTLVDRLEGLPLAITAAGAYLSQVPIRVAEYLEDYEQSWLELQQTTPSLPEHEGRTLQTTWNISFRHVESKSQIAANMLRLWAYFSSQDIWYELLSAQKQEIPEWFQSLIKSRLTFAHAMSLLTDHGLVEVDLEKRTYNLHSCLHDWVYGSLEHTMNNEMASIAISCISQNVQRTGNRNSFAAHRRLLGHAYHLYKRYYKLIELNKENVYHMHNLGELFRFQRKFLEAEAIHKLALGAEEVLLGPLSSITLDTANSLGLTYLQHGTLGFTANRKDKLRLAEAFFQTALKGREKILGPNDLLTLETVHNIAHLFYCLGDMPSAESYFYREMRSRVATLGVKNLYTVQAFDGLGAVYAEQNKTSAAISMYKQAKIGYEALLGSNHELTKMVRRKLDACQQKSAQRASQKANRHIRPHSDKPAGPREVEYFQPRLISEISKKHHQPVRSDPSRHSHNVADMNVAMAEPSTASRAIFETTRHNLARGFPGPAVLSEPAMRDQRTGSFAPIPTIPIGTPLNIAESRTPAREALAALGIISRSRTVGSEGMIDSFDRSLLHLYQQTAIASLMARPGPIPVAQVPPMGSQATTRSSIRENNAPSSEVFSGTSSNISRDNTPLSELPGNTTPKTSHGRQTPEPFFRSLKPPRRTW